MNNLRDKINSMIIDKIIFVEVIEVVPKTIEDVEVIFRIYQRMMKGESKCGGSD